MGVAVEKWKRLQVQRDAIMPNYQAVVEDTYAISLNTIAARVSPCNQKYYEAFSTSKHNLNVRNA
jgi:hypothetical protein